MSLTAKERWDLVRGSNIQSSLRLTLYALHCFQGNNRTAFCKRETLADEVGCHVDQLSRKLQALELLGVITSVWTKRNERPSREHSINYAQLAKMQRATLTNSSECSESSLTNSSESTLTFSTGHSDEFIRPTLTNSSDMKIHRTSKEDSIGAALPKESSSKFSEQDLETAKWMFNIVQQLQPECKIPNFTAWAKDIRLMRERDNRTDTDIRELFSAADADEFWQSNIRCPAKLRKQWDNLDLKIRKAKPGKKQIGPSEDWIEVQKAVAMYSGSQNWAKRKEMLGPERFEAMKRLNRNLSELSAYDLKALEPIFESHLKDVRRERGTSGNAWDKVRDGITKFDYQIQNSELRKFLGDKIAKAASAVGWDRFSNMNDFSRTKVREDFEEALRQQ